MNRLALGYTRVKDEMLKSITAVYEVGSILLLVCLRDMCYAILPWAFDELQNTKKRALRIVSVESLLDERSGKIT